MSATFSSQTKVIASLGTTPNGGLRQLAQRADWLEIRGDLFSDFDRQATRSHFAGNLVYTLRSACEGGKSTHSAAERRKLLCEAAQRYDLVDLEGERDLIPGILHHVRPEQRVISWTGKAKSVADLESRLAQFQRHPAKLYRFVVQPTGLPDCFVPLNFLKKINRPEVSAAAAGPENIWTRLLAAKLGAPLIFANADKAAGDSETLETLQKLKDDYGIHTPNSIDQIFAIVGNPVSRSLSPRLHNSAYRVKGLSSLFVYLSVESFGEFWSEIVEKRAFDNLGMPLRGFTLGAPHKSAGLTAAQSVAPLCRRAKSCNVLLNGRDGWKADTTDASGLLDCFREIAFSPADKRVAVVGCGGSGRTMAAALDDAGAEVVLVNRGTERGIWASKLLNLPWISLQAFSPSDYDVVINATPVGRTGDMLPIDLSQLSRNGVVVDLVYSDLETRWMRTARSLGLRVIDGSQILASQVAQQHRLMTGSDMPKIFKNSKRAVFAH